jgi:hypothetical protein
MTEVDKYMISKIENQYNNDNIGNICVGRVISLAYMVNRNIYPDNSFSESDYIVYGEFCKFKIHDREMFY